MPDREYRVTCGVPRAFVPLKSHDATRDVLLARNIDARESPYPFALAIFESTTNRPAHCARPFQIFYVSSYVANDRNPKSNPRNPGGVREGWYVITKPETTFEVRYAIINRRWTGNILENLLVTHLYVDGKDSRYCNHHIIGDNVTVPFPDVVIRGFCTTYNRISSAREEYTFKKFKFVKSKFAEAAQTHNSDKEQGTIQLRVKAAQAVRSSRIMEWDAQRVRLKKTGTRQIISEKAMAKEGKSLQVEGAEYLEEACLQTSPYSTEYERKWTGAEITVYVRELSWMRSRRLIDDKGRPCTYTMYKELLEKDQGEKASAKRKRIISSSDIPRPLKKIKTEEEEPLIASGNPTTSAVNVATKSGAIDLTKSDDESVKVKDESVKVKDESVEVKDGSVEVKDESNIDVKSEPHIGTKPQVSRRATNFKTKCIDIVDLT